MPATSAAEWIRQGLAHHGAGRLEAAEGCYRQALAADPGGWDAPHLIGLVAHAWGRHAEAAEWVGRAVRAKPDEPGFWFNLGNVLAGGGRDAEAVDAYRRAVALKADFADAHRNLANTLERLGRLPEAITVREAVARLAPNDAEAHAQFGYALHRLGHLDPAVAAYERAVALRPGDATSAKRLATALTGVGRAAEAVAAGRRAVALDPVDPAAASNLLMAMQYADATDPGELFAEHVWWGDRHGAVPPVARTRPSGGRLRVGYVSGDLRNHPVGTFLAPLLERHDRGRFEVFCYSNRAATDAVTGRLRAAAEHWREVHALTDDAAAALIASDGIDLLVDLSGHTADGRLGVFARRPAAVQATYLGYPATTGLAAIDYRITDAVADPPGVTERLHRERLVRLPRCFLCFDPPADAPAVATPTGGPVTFGSFNAAAKVTPTTVRLWAGVLARVPGSVLALKAVGLMGEPTRRRLRAEFAAAGVAAERVQFWAVDADQRDHLGRYGAVDVALDTVPYNGTTTTADALWMGVPVVTLAGRTHASRVGASLLSCVGRGEWVTETPEAFAEVAARCVAEGRGGRQALRDRVAASPLCDAAGFAAAMEAAYLEMVAARR